MHQRHQPRPRPRPAAPAADALVPQHLGLTATRARARRDPAPVGEAADRDRGGVSARGTPDARGRCCSWRNPRRKSLFTDNETNFATRFRRARHSTPFQKDGIERYLLHGETGAVNPALHRHQGRAPLSSTFSRRAKRGPSGCVCCTADAVNEIRASRSTRRSIETFRPPRARRPTSSTDAACARTPSTRKLTQHPAAGVCRDALEQAVL